MFTILKKTCSKYNYLSISQDVRNNAIAIMAASIITALLGTNKSDKSKAVELIAFTVIIYLLDINYQRARNDGIDK